LREGQSCDGEEEEGDDAEGLHGCVFEGREMMFACAVEADSNEIFLIR